MLVHALSFFSVLRFLPCFFLWRNISFGRCGPFRINTEAQEKTCNICLESFEGDKLVGTKLCGDMYRGLSLFKWLTTDGRRKACPICNQDVEVFAKVSSSKPHFLNNAFDLLKTVLVVMLNHALLRSFWRRGIPNGKQNFLP
jgi:hypothetical protein